MPDDLTDIVFDHANRILCTLLAHADALMAAHGPLRMAAGEPWEEADEAYRARLGFERFSHNFVAWIAYAGRSLDDVGKEVGLPRARLARVEG